MYSIFLKTHNNEILVSKQEHKQILKIFNILLKYDDKKNFKLLKTT